MFSKIINYILSQTKIGSLLNGHKTEIGFLLWVLGYIIDGLAIALSVFPGLPGLIEAQKVLVVLHTQVSEFLKSFGFGVMTIGLGHKAIKDNAK